MSDIVAHHAITRMHLREQAIAKEYHLQFAAALQALAKADPAAAQERFMNEVRGDLCEAYGFQRGNQTKPFAFSQGVAIIPVHGSLINRFGSSYSFLTGYNFIRAQHNAALLDPDVTHIIHDHNSYGGEAAGCFELCDDIYASRGTKPIVAVVDSNCYSASYALASAADKIIVTPSSGVGSIGVVAMHISMSKMLKEIGVEITFIHSGDHKVDGNPYESLSPEVKADIQKGVDKSRANFVAKVARNRGIDAKIVYDTEARTYRADDALNIGLIDAVAAPAAALELIKNGDAADPAEPNENATHSTTENTMDQAQIKALQDKAAADQAAATASAAALAAATATATATAAAAAAPGATAAAAGPTAEQSRVAERARVQSITTSAEAKGREEMANHLAFKTEMSAADAIELLKVTPAAAAAAPAAKEGAEGNVFEAAMASAAHPKVGADTGKTAGGEGAPTTAEQAMAAYEMATGVKLA